MKSLRKVLDIIDEVGEAGSMGIREISSRTGFPSPTVHRILSTLVERGYLGKDPGTKKYALSLRFLQLGAKVQQRFNLPVVARPHMHGLMLQTKESVNLAVKDGDEMVYLDHIRSDYSLLQLFTQAGARVSLYATGVGKLFLSEMSKQELDSYLERVTLTPRTLHTLIEPRALRKELSRIRSQGFAVDNEEFEVGVRCVAAPLLNHLGEHVGAISISGAVVRITADRIEQFGGMVKRSASVISRDLGFSGPQENEIYRRKEKHHV
jgi:IclR family KDG regulon transcriptional repressor